MPEFQGGSIVNEWGVKSLRRYKYHGADQSLLYKYFLSPLAERCLVLLPSWMAPNLVTTIGLAFTTASYILMYVTAPGMISVDTPGWVFPISALGLFVYQTLDNMDGKQARRTGSSSPLGLIFDHGCDAINCCFGVVFVAVMLNAGSNLVLLGALVLNQLIPFFFTTWEHYYTDELVLPVINGPSEGVILGVVCACLRGVYGPDFFTTPRALLRGWPLGEIVVAVSLFGVLLTLIKQCANVAGERSKRGKGMAGPTCDAFFFVFLLSVGAGWGWGRPALFHATPYTMVLLFGLLHVDMAVHVMVCHVCNMVCRPFRPILIALLVVVGNSFLRSEPVVDEETLVWVFTAATFAYEAFYLYLVIVQTSRALDIFVFQLGKRSAAEGRENASENDNRDSSPSANGGKKTS